MGEKQKSFIGCDLVATSEIHFNFVARVWSLLVCWQCGQSFTVPPKLSMFFVMNNEMSEAT
jgi:hypothetical protein